MSDPGQAAAADRDARPLVVHIVYRFGVGGLENGVVNLINHMPRSAYRHAVVALTEVAESFQQRIRRDDVRYLSLHKPPGHAIRLYGRLFDCFRQWRPAIVHTRNISALECQVPAWAAGVPARVHGEHGWDIGDLQGSRRRYQWVRRVYRPFISQYVALSGELTQYLQQKVHVAPGRVSRLCNGVDTRLFRPTHGPRSEPSPGCPFTGPGLFIIGTVGRMAPVKAQTLLARAFAEVLAERPALRPRLRLVMVGDGPLREESRAILAAAGVADLAWLPGERSDVPEVMRGLDLFVLPSLAEGISNTILEAMSSGLPVVATDTGGNAELVVDGETGLIVGAPEPGQLAAAVLRMADDPARAGAMGQAGRARVEARFSIAAMVEGYQSLYDRLLDARGATR